MNSVFSNFFVHFFAVIARLWRELKPNLTFRLWRAKRQDNYFLFLFLNLDKVITIQLQKHLLTFDEQKEIEYASAG